MKWNRMMMRMTDTGMYISDEKLKFLAETKKTFALSISTGVLYKQVNTLPCVIVRQITEAKADILIQKTSYPECYKFGK